MLSNMVEEDYSSNTTTLPESLLKKAARAYLVHTLQSQEQPSPMSKSILSDAFDVGTFDFKVFQDMIRRPLTANDIRHVMLAIGVNVEDEAQLVVAAMDLISFTGKIMLRTVDILQKIEANPPIATIIHDVTKSLHDVTKSLLQQKVEASPPTLG